MSDWRRLLGIALPAIDEAFLNAPVDPDSPQWTIGGGAAIAHALDHRSTKDVDIFVQRRRLKDFTPAANAADASAIAGARSPPGLTP